MQSRFKIRGQSVDALQSSAIPERRRLLTLTTRLQHVEGELAATLRMRALDVLERDNDGPMQKRSVRRLIPSAPHACSPVCGLLLLESLGRQLHA
jgi:hypothetical protein